MFKKILSTFELTIHSSKIQIIVIRFQTLIHRAKMTALHCNDVLHFDTIVVLEREICHYAADTIVLTVHQLF